MSSGLRINRASDDAAGLAIASKLQADTRVYTQAIRNLNDGISTLAIADGAYGALNNIVDRIKELASQSANGVYSSTQRRALNTEAQSLSAEYSRIVESTSFNGLRLLDGSISDVSIQAGFGSGERITASLSAAPLLSYNTISTTSSSDGTFADAAGVLDYGGDDVTLADLNNDGKLDLVSFRVDRVVSALGNGDGTFQPYNIEFQGGNSWGLIPGDLNGDGYTDIVTSDLYDGGAHVFMSQGDGTLSNSFFVNTSGTPGGVQLGDVNGDGKLDIVVADYSINKISVTLGNGDGTFQAQKTFNTATKPADLALRDFDNDGKLDVVTANATTFSILKGNGDGTFAAATTKTTASNPADLEAADLNNDGNLDLIYTRQLFPTGEVLVFLGNGNMTFGAAITMYADGRTSDSTIGDFNGDGKLDIASANYWQGMSIFFGNGDGRFQEGVVYDSPAGSPTSIAAGDINGDGVLDLGVGVAFVGAQVLMGNSVSSSTGSAVTVDLTTQSAARSALDTVAVIADSIAVQRGVIGAAESRIEAALRVTGARRENIQAAESRIADVDVASESATLAAAEIRKQISASLLAQVNQSSSFLVGLIRS